MLRGLWLGAGLVTSDQKHGGVHNRRTVKHGSHQNVVTRTIDERHVTLRREQGCKGGSEVVDLGIIAEHKQTRSQNNNRNNNDNGNDNNNNNNNNKTSDSAVLL